MVRRHRVGRGDRIDASYQSDILKALFVSTIIPLILLEVSTAGAGFVDGLAISQFLGTQELAISGLAYPYFSITGILAGLLVTGMQTLCAKAYGTGDSDLADAIFSMAMILGGCAAILLTAVLLLAPGPIGQALGAVGDAAELLPGLKLYLMGLGIGTPAIVLYTLLIPIAQMNGGGGIVRVAVILTLVVDVVLDIAAGLLGWGIFGMGLATSLASWVQFVLLLAYVMGPSSTVRFALHGAAWARLGSMIIMGLPKAIRRVANMLRPLFLNRLVIALGGSVAMSAMSIRNSLEGIGDVVGSGIAAAVMLMVGILLGEENRDGIMQICRLTLRYVFLWVGAVALALIVLAPWLASLYAGNDAAVAELATFAIRCMAVNLVLNALIEAYINFLQATEQVLKTHVVNVLSRFGCVVAFAFLLGNAYGISGVWMSFPVGSLALIAGIVVAAMIRKRSVAILPDDVLGLSEDFGAAPEDTLWYNVTTENPDYPITTEEIYDFCEEHGFDRKKAYRTALCLEEMVTNIVEHGFTSDDKPHSIDIRVVAKDDELILRVRDDCELFNVREKGESWKERPDNMAEDIGIRLTMASAKDLRYVNTLGTNTLLITV